MRKWVSIGVVAALLCSSPMGVVAAASRQQANRTADTGTLVGQARDARGQALASTKVRMRDMRTGAVAAETLSDEAGTFTLTVAPGNYVVELVDSLGHVIGLSPTIAIGAGATATVTVSATAAGIVTATGSSGGLSLFGLGPAASMAVITAAGLASVTGVVAARHRHHPSPSR